MDAPDVVDRSPLIEEAIGVRREFHRWPELAYNEHRTADFVADYLAALGLTVHRGLAGTGVVGTLSRGNAGRSIGIRADMDALPILEKSGVPHTSMVDGVMHACGHDGHTAILLAAAKAATTLPGLNGTVHFIFQPAEENEGGGRRMVEEGLFRLFPCDAVFALHNWPSLPLGSCIIPDGAVMAALGLFEIELLGQGCHGAMPHQGKDVLLGASHLNTALQSITSRNIDARDAAVLSVTQIRGGDTWNTIPDRCLLRGTARWFDDLVGAALEGRLREITSSVAATFGCQSTVRFEVRIPPTINDARYASTVRRLVQAPSLQLQLVDSAPSMTSEDFAYLLQACPGAYLLLGSGEPERADSLHSPNYDFNDKLIPIGIQVWIELIAEFLVET